MATKPTFTLTIKHDDAILITEQIGYTDFLHQPIMEYIEVSCDIDRKHLRVAKDKYSDSNFKYRLLRDADDPLANWQHDPLQYVSEKSVLAAQRLLRKHIKSLGDVLEKGRQHPAYLEMDEIAKNTLQHYTDDFYWHDIMTLGRNNPSTFIWMVHQTGTWFVTHKSKGALVLIDLELKTKDNELYLYENGKLDRIGYLNLTNCYNRLPVLKPDTWAL
jgi:hypothetical protein